MATGPAIPTHQKKERTSIKSDSLGTRESETTMSSGLNESYKNKCETKSAFIHNLFHVQCDDAWALPCLAVAD